ncbi:MAG: hypothetical protein OXN97_21340 [Bryobacterales bacterium]|nr:hypothetical protein [Bryobacterales bacterium]MDE0626072.1 hypothetical protein [Bryobacterales bacterium]
MSKPASSHPRKLPRDAGESSVPPVAIALLLGIALLAGAQVYTLLQLDEFREDVGSRLDTHDERLALLDGNVARTSSELESRVGEVRSLVESTEEELATRTREVESRVLGETKTLQKEIEDARETSQAKITEVGGKLAEYQETTITEVGALGGRVDTVKQEVEANRAELEKTIAALTSVKGDLGVQSGLIATNAGELDALKRLGERNYYEFNLAKTKRPQRVGPVSIKLSGTDRKRNRYSIELWADDKRIVKRRKTLLEPVQFYVQGARVPYELVVNQIDNGNIGGYLATPKDGPRGS